MGRDAELRLLLALAVSAALHLSLICGVAVGPSESAPGRMILARLMPGTQAPPVAPTRTHASGRSAAAAAASEPTDAVPTAAGVPESSPEAVAESASVTPAHPDERRLPGVDVPMLVDPTWYTAKDLDLYPHPLVPVHPAYPASIPDITGEVTLQLLIDEFGVVQELSVVTAEPAGYFEGPALHAFETAHFAPAQRDGRPVRSRIVIKVRFAPQIQTGAER